MKLHGKNGESVEKYPSLTDRLVTAILAPVAFNFSLFILLALILGSSGSRILIRSQVIYKIPPNLAFIFCILLPALLGFMMGLSKFSTLFGHLFYTNQGNEKNGFITILAWLGFFCVAYLMKPLLS